MTGVQTCALPICFRFLAEVAPHFKRVYEEKGTTDPQLLQILTPHALDDAAHAQPDEPDPDDRDRIAREGNDVGLSRPAFLRMVTAGRTAAEEDRK